MISLSHFAQGYAHKGRVIDAESGEAVSCASIRITEYIEGISLDTLIFTDENGVFTYLSYDSFPYLDVSIQREDYLYKYLSDYYLEYDSLWVIKLSNKDCSCYSDSVYADKDFYFDFNALRISYMPFIGSMDEKYSNYFTFSTYIFEPQLALNRIQKLGFRISYLDFTWLRFDSKYSLATVPVKKERYFSFGGSAYIFHRLIVPKKKCKEQRGWFLDLGAGYHYPYYFSYVYKLDNSVKLVNSDVYKYNDLRAFARLGYGPISIYGTYRFFDVMQVGYPEPPQWEFGLEFPIPANM